MTDSSGDLRIDIDLAAQSLTLLGGPNGESKHYPVSTASNGAGEQNSSLATPRGWHRIRAKIGAGAPVGTVFKGRRSTGEIYSEQLAAEWPRHDWILTRILWLSGLEPGFNRFGNVDTMRRFIYIHGSHPGAVMGEPGSIGCIRMTNNDVIDLFDRVSTATRVWIHE